MTDCSKKKDDGRGKSKGGWEGKQTHKKKEY